MTACCGSIRPDGDRPDEPDAASSDWFDAGYDARSPRENPEGPPAGPARVMRGGWCLCHESYCWRHRVDARTADTADSTTGKLGFRVVAA